MDLPHSLQTRLALGYFCIIAALLVLMNTYPMIMNQNLLFRSKQTTMANQAALVTNTLVTADELTSETVTQAIAQLEDLEVQRLVVTDEAGLVLYDTGEDSAVGKYLFLGEIVSALEGNDAFSSRYQDGVFYSRWATPVMDRNQVVGAVYLYEEDSSQGALLVELQRNLRLISAVVCLAGLVLFGAFSASLSRRVRALLGGIRTVRAGEYTHRISLPGHDELAQLADEFNQLTGRLQVTEEERRRFVSDASHELKTPLASIRLLTDSILQDENIDQATTREFVADIGEAADRLIRISQELLELNRLDEGRTLLREPVDLNAQVEKAVRLLQPLAESAQVTLETDLGEDCTVLCNTEDAIQILRNLMENAIKYNVPQGKVWVTGSAWKWRTPAWASPRRTCPRSSSGFTGWIRPAPGRPGAPAWACPSSGTPCAATGGRSPWPPERQPAWCSPCCFWRRKGGHRRELRPQSGFRPAAGPAHLDSLGRVRPNRGGEWLPRLLPQPGRCGLCRGGGGPGGGAPHPGPGGRPCGGASGTGDGPAQGENLTSALPEGVSLRSWTLNNGLLTVDFSSTYGTLSGIDLTLADYSVVLTLTQLEEVETVMITVGGEMLSYRDHQRMTAEDIVS